MDERIDSPKSRTTPAAKRSRAVSRRRSHARAHRDPKAAAAVRRDEDIIRDRVYDIYVQRGHHGDPMEDRLLAERELIEQTAG